MKIPSTVTTHEMISLTREACLSLTEVKPNTLLIGQQSLDLFIDDLNNCRYSMKVRHEFYNLKLICEMQIKVRPGYGFIIYQDKSDVPHPTGKY